MVQYVTVHLGVDGRYGMRISVELNSMESKRRDGVLEESEEVVDQLERDP